MKFLLLLALASSSQAAEPRADKIEFARYSDPTVSFDYPAGWTVSVLTTPSARRCQINIYKNRRWFQSPLKTHDWNDIEITFLNLDERLRAVAADGVRDASELRGLPDYRRGIECRPPDKTPLWRPPLFDVLQCEEPLGTIPLASAKTKGYLYRPLDEHVSSDPAFNAVFREANVFFAAPNDPKWIYLADYTGPGAEYDRYWPAFKRLLSTMRLSPNAATLCGEAKAAPPAPENLPSEAPVDGGGAVPLLR